MAKSRGQKGCRKVFEAATVTGAVGKGGGVSRVTLHYLFIQTRTHSMVLQCAQCTVNSEYNLYIVYSVYCSQSALCL